MGVGLMDGFGLAMFLPLLQMVDNSNAEQAQNMGSLSFLISAIKKLGIPLHLASVLIIISLFFILKGLAMYINNIYDVNVRMGFIRHIRESFTNDFALLSYKSFSMSDSGKIQNTLSGEVERVSQAYTYYFNAFQQFSLVLMYMVFAFFVNAQFATLITIGGILTNSIFKAIYKKTKKASGKLTHGTNQYQGLIIQYVANFKYLKASASLKKYNEKLLNTIDDIQYNNERIGALNAIVLAVREPLLIIVVCAVIFLQVTFFEGTLAAILISLLFFYRALNALILMQTYYNSFLSVTGSLDNMEQFDNELKQNAEHTGNTNIDTFKNNIELKNATFFYGKKKILDNINLNIRKNESVAFVGESGSGKTTLINLLVGLMPLDEGQFYIDGITRDQLNIESYQQRIGYITQEAVVFNDTIFNNITFWDKPAPQNIERFYNVLKKAALHDFVQLLPKKENELLGNNGVNLSGGQRQRISIARELYKDIDILVLDEATSSLDSETEKSIQDNIDSLKGEYTLLIVAHRLSTVKYADRIFLLEDGKIDNFGSYAELYNKSDKFRKMVMLQEV
ncbi:MAG: ABC transporter ATP-binding protein [Arachidicoccus sp.]|nr:ABC transporter ATP-binding protein [Arachidicoccus sp.]